ncbi:MAG: 6-phosphofructokinase [Chloroflexi bacterium]|nr:6-phosphofructokinase [Chloroflexota bacterium]
MAKLALLTSGGDAPGMNSAIRAVVRTALAKGIEVIGIRHGFSGLLAGDSIHMNSRSVANIMHLGGTILHTSRCLEFKTKEGRAPAVAFLDKAKVDFLVIIGGNGTLQGSAALSEETETKIVQIPSTIDNDVYGTDFTIGFDTAVNTALDAIDRIRDTAFSLDRLFFVEVMGREAGFIALEAGIAGGAVEVLIPEIIENMDQLSRSIQDAFKRGKKACITVVAEGDRPGGAFEVAKEVKALTGLDSRVCILGHTQRGGSPTARDRVLAIKLGVAAIETLLQGENAVVIGEVCGQIVRTPLKEAREKKKQLDHFLVELLKLVSG